MADVAAAPVGETGHAGTGGFWELESTPELFWPLSVQVYDRMRRQDAQVGSVLRAVTLPVRSTQWRIDPDGCREEVVRLVSEDLGLPVKGEELRPTPRTRDRFSWDEHLRLALLMLTFGHAYFEQVYRIDDRGRARLRKLGPRLPRTISEIDIAQDGGLVAIRQRAPEASSPSGIGTFGSSRADVVIPVNRLVAYINDREGGNWLGNSLLRQAYKNWLIKDRLLRVQAQTIERNGMGVPLYKGPENPAAGDLEKGKALASAWRSGDAAGAAVAHGADLILRGVEGDLPDAEPAIRYHDEQIARAVLAHFLNLGTQTGSWALGSTFADFFLQSLTSVAKSVADTATQHIVEDLVDLNWGEEEPAPKIVFDKIGGEQQATAQAIKFLIDSGVVFPDRTLEESVRQTFNLPPKQPLPPGTAPVPGQDMTRPETAPAPAAEPAGGEDA
jgi:hypothetical protein